MVLTSLSVTPERPYLSLAGGQLIRTAITAGVSRVASGLLCLHAVAIAPWLSRQARGIGKVCIVHSTRGTFASHVARGVVEAATAEHSVELIPYSTFDFDDLMRKVQAPRPEILVVAGGFEEEKPSTLGGVTFSARNGEFSPPIAIPLR